MKNSKLKSLGALLSFIFLLASLAMTGCAKKIAVDTVKLEYSFQTADESTQPTVTSPIESIEKAYYAGALHILKKVAADPKTTADQKTAVNGVIAQIEKP